jgi:hypothetical protein
MVRTKVSQGVANRLLLSKRVSLLLLFLLWTGIGILFALSWYLPAGAEGRPIQFKTAVTWYLLDSYLWLALCPLIFYLHRRFPLGAGRVWDYFLHLLLALCVAWLHFSALICLDKLLDPAFPSRFQTVHRAMTQLIIFRTISGVVTYTLVVAVCSARQFYAGLRSEREHRATLEYQLASAELAALKMQLHPHFLFNALHSVSALIDERPREAVRMITKLGTFLRVTLESSADQMVSLDEEARFLELYFDIEQIRVGDRVTFLLQIDPATRLVQVPTLILQPLVENALRHGPQEESGQTCISVVSRHLGSSVEIIVRNELREPPPYPPKPIREGVGLSNVRSRLEQLYTTRFQFEYGWVATGLFQVSLVVPLESGWGEL